jgi:hypothetical protein
MKQPRISEKAIQAAVVDHWRAMGVPDSLVAAIPNARAFGQPGLHKGLFDLLVIAPGFGVGFIELKTELGELSSAQKEFKQVLLRAGVNYAVCIGRDAPIQVLEQWRIVRRAAA